MKNYRDGFAILQSVTGDSQELISNLFNNYKDWAKDSEEYLFGKRAFVQKMEERGFPKIQTTATQFDGAKKKGWFLKGVALTETHKKFTKQPTPKPRK